MIDAVVIVSCARDLAVNRISVPAVIEHIDAASYTIVVPDNDIDAFRRALPGEIVLVPERALLPAWPLERVAAALPRQWAGRAGWYLQQFLKLEAVRQMPAYAEALIWDGDTVPLRTIAFKDNAGRIGFYSGRERHEPYFQTIRQLLGLERATSRSFIAQCLYTPVTWVNDMIGQIERRTNADWIAAIIAALPGESPSEFSEYETVGTFALSNHPERVYLNDRPWFRWGMAHFGGIEGVTAKGLGRLGRRYDYVALESWDRGPAARLRSIVQRLRDAGEPRPRLSTSQG